MTANKPLAAELDSTVDEAFAAKLSPSHDSNNPFVRLLKNRAP
jgi:hypothetical protein